MRKSFAIACACLSLCFYALAGCAPDPSNRICNTAQIDLEMGVILRCAFP